MTQTQPTAVSRYVVRDGGSFRQEPTIVGTKVMVRDVVELWRSGVIPEKIPARLFNLISAAQVFDAIGFYLDNQLEIDEYIEWYRSRPPLNVPAGLRLNPLRQEVASAIEGARLSQDKGLLSHGINDQIRSDRPNAFELFEAAGLVGCIEGDPNLSSQY